MSKIFDQVQVHTQISESFGTTTFRGVLKSNNQPILLLMIPFREGQGESRAHFLSLIHLWVEASAEIPALLEPIDWELGDHEAHVLFPDSGGKTLTEQNTLFEPKDNLVRHMSTLLSSWEELQGKGYFFTTLDPHRWILKGGELKSMDLIHLSTRQDPRLLWTPPFSSLQDLAHLSPEMTNRTSLAIDHRSGLYSLGSILYHFLTGHPPLVKAEILPMIHAMLSAKPALDTPLLSSANPFLVRIVEKLLEKNPENRYQTYRGLKWDLSQRVKNPDADFKLGSRDRSQAISEIRGIYGRSEVLKPLMDVLAQGKKGVGSSRLLRGAGGVGKSWILQELRKKWTGEEQNWIVGQFEPLGQERFTKGAWARVLEKVTSLILSQPAQVQQEWSHKLESHLSRHLQILVILCPSLEKVWGDFSDLPYLDPEGNRKRFLTTVLHFLRVSMEYLSPVVLVLEDLQGADPLGAALFQELSLAPIPELVVLGSTRPSGPFSPDPLQETETYVVDIQPLELDDIEQILKDTTELAEPEKKTLAQLLWKNSGGSPFFLKELLRELDRRQALVMEGNQDYWSLKADRLQNLPQSEELLSLVEKQLLNLNQPQLNAVICSALFGKDWEIKELALGAQVPLDALHAWAEEMEVLGIWERTLPGHHRFSHDRIQEVALSLATPDLVQSFHAGIGREKKRRLEGGEAISPTLLADHFGACPDLLTPEERRELIQWNFRAGKESRTNGDYPQSYIYLWKALEGGGRDLWDQDPVGTWELFLAAMEAAYLENHREAAQEICEEAISRSSVALHRAKIRERQQSLLYLLGDPEASIQAGYLGLKELGLQLPLQPKKINVMGSLIKLKWALRKKDLGDLEKQKVNTNESSKLAMLLYCGFIPSAFLSGKQSLFGISVLRAARLTLKDGLSPESAPSYTGYAVLLAAMGDLKGAYKFGKLAVAINRQFQDLTWRPMVLVLTSLFGKGWMEPWSELRGQFLEASRVAETTGEILYKAYADFYATLWNPQDDIKTQIAQLQGEAIPQIQKSRYSLTLVSSHFALGELKNLEGSASPSGSFDSPGFSAAQGLEESRSRRSLTSLAVCHLFELKHAFHRGEPELLKRTLDRLTPLQATLKGSLFEETLCLFVGLASADLVRWGEKNHRKDLKAWVKRAQDWSTLSQSFETHYHLLWAEELDLQGQDWEAQNHFIRAVDAAEKGYLQRYLALSQERLALFFQRKGKTSLAKLHGRPAVQSWRRYGALKKAEAMENQLGLTNKPLFNRDPPQAGLPANLDWASLLLILETVSKEIHLDTLVIQLSRILLENSGAEKVILFMPEGEKLGLVCETTGLGTKVWEGQDWENYPPSMVNLLRESLMTQTSLVINHHEGEGSLVILPLVHHGEVKALAYLENRLLGGVLTQERTRALERISTAIGIALQNAQLFEEVNKNRKELEQRVEERTRELKATQKKIILQEKLASLGTLTAGIAHELKNPLNLILNFAESSKEMIDEVASQLQGIKKDLPASVGSILDYLIPEVSQNMTDLTLQSKRGHSIIQSMLLHSRSEKGVATQENLHNILREAYALSFHGFRGTHRDFNCQLVEDLDSAVDSFLLVRSSLSRVFINLFHNAFYAMETKRNQGATQDYTPCLHLQTQKRGDIVAITLEDNGIGIPADHLDKIFQHFFTTKPPGEGTGLGLSLSFEILRDEANGSLEVLSEEGRWTRFVVQIPITPLSPAPSSPKEDTPGNSHSG